MLHLQVRHKKMVASADKVWKRVEPPSPPNLVEWDEEALRQAKPNEP